MRRHLLLVVGICAFTWSSHAAQFAPAEPQLGAPKPGTATIVGQVVDAVTGDPVAGALVSAVFATVNEGTGGTPPPPTQRRIVATANGRFVLTRVAPGPVVISASASGYMNAGYGQRVPMGDSRALVVTEGQRLDTVTIRMWKPAVVEGRLVDEAGEPLVRVAVRALRRGWSSGKPAFAGNNSSTTDDRGVFRITDLIPGDWVFVMAASYQTTPESVRNEYRRLSGLGGSAMQAMTRAMSASGAPSAAQAGDRLGAFLVQYPTGLEGLRPTADGGWLGYAPAYFPALGPDGLEVLRLSAGEERSGIEMRAQPSRVVSVSGRVLGPEGPVAMIGVRLRPVALAGAFPEETFETARASTDITGAFTFIGVPAGEYDLRVERIPRPELSFASTVVSGPNGAMVTSLGAPNVSPSPPAEPTLSALQRVSVGDRDVTGISVSLGVGPRVSGKAEFAGNATLPTAEQLQAVGVTLRPLDRMAITGTTAARFDAEGRFQSAGFPPGRYVVQAASPGGGWFMQSAMLGGKDVSIEPLVLNATDIAGIVVTYSDRRTEISGSVIPAQGGDTDAVLVAFPSDLRTWIRNGLNNRQLRFARSSSDGRYVLAALPAGSYLVAALPADTVATLEPEFFESIAQLATTAVLSEGEKRALDLRVNRPRDDEDADTSNSDEGRVSGPFVPDADQQQAPARDVVAVAVGTGSISGVVTLDDEARTPVRRARVRLTGSAGTVTLITATDDQGRFTFRDLPPVRYNLSAERAGLVNAAYGSTKPGDMTSRPLALAEGQQLTGVALTMGRGAVITGRVLDEFGRSAERAELTLLQSRVVNGVRTWTEAVGSFVGANFTDDRGVYRLYGLPPGEYLIGVIGRSTSGEIRRVTDAELQWAERRSNDPPPAQGPIVGSAPFYYPGTADPASATPVRVSAGEVRDGIDVTIRYVRNSRVSGRVEMPDGSVPRNVQLLLYSEERVTALGASFVTRVNPDGSFTMAPAPPGKYTLTARAAPNVAAAPEPGAAPGGRGGAPAMSLWFMQDVVLSGDDITGVVVALSPGLKVSGRVTFDATTAPVPPDPRALSVRLVQVATGGVSLGLPAAQLNADGTFVVEGVVPGSYRVTVGMPVRTGSLPTWTVRHVMHDGRDAADYPIEIKAGSDVSGIEAVLTDRVTEVSGVVMDQQGKPMTDHSVIVLPVDKSLWTVGPRRRPAPQRPDTAGRFRMIDLAQGEYYLAVVADLQGDQLTDTTFLESLIPSAIKFKLAEGERKVQDVKLAGGGYQ